MIVSIDGNRAFDVAGLTPELRADGFSTVGEWADALAGVYLHRQVPDERTFTFAVDGEVLDLAIDPSVIDDDALLELVTL
jgi:hypothetical protein